MERAAMWIAACAVLAACQPEPPREDGVLRIVATTGMLGDAVRQLAPPDAEVSTLMGPGVDPHLYKAAHSDVQRLLAADLIVYNGLHLEGKMGEVLRKLQRIRPVYAAGEAPLLASRLHVSNAQGSAHDPHIWFDVALWRDAVAALGSWLAAHDSGNAALIRRRTAAYTAQLDSLHRWTQTELARVPAPQRILITAHDAFGYFGAAYDVEVRGLQGISTVAEFGLRDVNELVDYIVRNRIPALFVESSVSPKAIEAVVAGCRARGHAVRIGGTLFSDALGAAGTPEGTYIGMVTANVRTIVAALQPSADPTPVLTPTVPSAP